MTLERHLVWVACVLASACSSKPAADSPSPSPSGAASAAAKTKLAAAVKAFEAADRAEADAALARIERLTADRHLSQALAAPPGADRQRLAEQAFMQYLANERETSKADVLALVAPTGEVVAMHDVANPDPGLWRASGPGARTNQPVIDLALRGTAATGTAVMKSGAFRIAARPLHEDVASDGDTPVVGAAVAMYALDGRHAFEQARAAGGELGYFVRLGGSAFSLAATSFRQGDQPDRRRDDEFRRTTTPLTLARLDGEVIDSSVETAGGEHTTVHLVAKTVRPAERPQPATPTDPAVLVLVMVPE